MPRRNYVELEEDEDIYIECNPVDEKGEVISIDTAQSGNINLNDPLSGNIKIDFTDNLGIQALIGISLMVFLYMIGDYVFKVIPKQQLNKRL